MDKADWVFLIHTEIIILGNIIGWQTGKSLRKKYKKGKS